MSEAYFSTAAAEYGLQVWLGRGQGLPCAGHRWFQTLPAGSRHFQLAPKSLLQCTAEPLSQAGGTSGKRSMAQWIISVAHGDPTLEERESTKKEWQRGTSVLLATLMAFTHVSCCLTERNVTCSDSNEQGQ